MLGRFNQRPSIKTTLAQCPAAAKGFIKYYVLCKNYPADKRRRTNTGSTLVRRLRRWTNATPAKLETTTQSGSTAGPPFRTPAQEKNNIGPLPAFHGPKAGPSSTTITQHRAGTLAHHCTNTGRTPRVRRVMLI